MIPDYIVNNFAALIEAAKQDALALMECHDENGKAVVAICGVVAHEDGEIEMDPVGMMFLSDPREFLVPPMDEDDGGYPPCEVCGDPIDYCQGHGEIAESVSSGDLVVVTCDNADCGASVIDVRPQDVGDCPRCDGSMTVVTNPKVAHRIREATLGTLRMAKEATAG